MLPPFDGFVGGSYSGTPPSNTQNYPYARLLNDQGGQFSTLNWYDRLGRVVVSQNTKQRNYATPAYSYSLYDELNRVIEVGQKTENTDTANNFNHIFGDTVMSFYNPNVINPSNLLTWIKDNTGARTEVTHSYYDIQDILPTKILAQNELRNRVASATYADTVRSDSTKFNNATYYSYDVHGNVQTLIQDDSIPSIAGQRYKRLDYQYDLVSGNVNEMDYQIGNIDQYHQRYTYDADNRITQVQTSKDSIMWDNDASYFYYAHLPLGREEIGDQQVQGVDYAYTLEGWLKGVNSDLLDSNRDMGHDGLQVPGNLNRYFARDAYGFTLKYFKGEESQGVYGDYDAINKKLWNDNVSRFEAYDYNSDLMNARHDLFNGNITAMVTDIEKPMEYTASYTVQPTPLPQGAAYNYDQLDRLIDMKAYQNLDTNNFWGLGSTYTGLYRNNFSYDENGNILRQQRNDSAGNLMSVLKYQYNIQSSITIQNRLYLVNDSASTPNPKDIQDQGTFNSTPATINQVNNYRYNALGELAKDISGGIDTIIWTNYYKVWKIRKHTGDSIKFVYDAKGEEVEKEFIPAIGAPTVTYYVRNAQGNILTIYKKQVVGLGLSFSETERDIYGKKRIGVENTPVQMIGSIPVSQVDTFSRYLEEKSYELDNHLGNVLVVISDRKIPISNASAINDDHYEADIFSSHDYYPFGWVEPGRDFKSSIYRYAFNGKEKIDEIYGADDAYDYGKRTYNDRLGIFLSRDPSATQYPSLSPYQFASLNPIAGIDLDGLEYYYAGNGSLLGVIGPSTEVRVVNDEDTKVVTAYIKLANDPNVVSSTQDAAGTLANFHSKDVGLTNKELNTRAMMGSIRIAEGHGKLTSYRQKAGSGLLKGDLSTQGHPAGYHDKKGILHTQFGAYQVTKETWNETRTSKALGLPDKVSEANQDKVAQKLITDKAGTELATGDISGAVGKLKGAWSSLPGGKEPYINGVEKFKDEIFKAEVSKELKKESDVNTPQSQLKK